MGIKGVSCVSVGYDCGCNVWEHLLINCVRLYMKIRARGCGDIAGSYSKRHWCLQYIGGRQKIPTAKYLMLE